MVGLDTGHGVQRAQLGSEPRGAHADIEKTGGPKDTEGEGEAAECRVLRAGG